MNDDRISRRAAATKLIPLSHPHQRAPVSSLKRRTESRKTDRQWSFSRNHFCPFTLLAFLVWLGFCRLFAIVTGRVDGGPVWDESWVVVPGTKPTAIVMMLADDGKKILPFRNESIQQDKIAYFQRHGYALIVASAKLDAARLPQWSKLRLIYKALQHYETVLWLDVDTLVWDKDTTVESRIPTQYSLIAQLDLHKARATRYFNSGVMIFRNNPFTMSLLEEAYRQWQVVLLKGIYYFNTDQEGLNHVIARLEPREYEKHVQLHGYNGMWALHTHIDQQTWVVHFPNCWDCAEVYLERFRQIMS